jgi:hypothetical protein
MSTRWIGLLAASFSCAHAQWMTPRARATDYAAHAELNNGASIGAENLGHNMPTAKGVIAVPDYLVIEVAVYSTSTPIHLNAGNFILRLNGRKTPLMTQAPALVTASLKYSDWEARPRVTAAAGPLIVGAPDRVARFPGDPAGPVSYPIPRAPTEASRVDPEQPAAVEDIVNHHALPEGEVHPPVSGYLFFPYRGKLKSLKRVELLYEGPIGAAALLLP